MTNKENDADKGIVHFGGESKEEIEAEDRWHDEQIIKTDKSIAKRLNAGLHTQYVDSRIPEEREVDSKIETTVTSASIVLSDITQRRLKKLHKDWIYFVEEEIGTDAHLNPYKYDIEEWWIEKLQQALAEEREKYTKDINFLKKLHSMELDALSLKSLEDFMKWSDDRRHTPVSPILSSLDINKQ